MEHYLLVKNIHIATAVLSLVGFCIRGWWMFSENDLLQNRLVKTFPHVNDTILLSCAIYLSVTSTLYPFLVGWLGAKVLLLIGYILAGTIALKRGKTKQVRVVSFLLSLSFIGSIFILALFKPSL